MSTLQPARLRVLVTGAAGFIGRHLLADIERRRSFADIIPLDRRLRDHHGVDLRDTAGVRKLIGRRALTHVVHASGGDAHLPIEMQHETHVDATRSLLDALAGQPPGLRLINIGSSSQYGRQDPCITPLLSEDRPDHPLSVYAESKSQQERLVEEAARAGNLEAVYLRLFNPIGIGQKSAFLVPNLLAQVLASNDETVCFRIRDPDSRRDFVDVRDVAEAVCATMVAPGAAGEKLNVCSGQATMIADLARLLATVAGRRCTVARSASFDPEIPYQRGDRRRIHDLCGWKPGRSLEESVRYIWEASRVPHV